VVAFACSGSVGCGVSKRSTLSVFVGGSLACVLLGTLPVVLAQHGPQQRGVTPVSSTGSSAQQGGYYALVIGINHYQHYTPLSTPLDDAKELTSILHDKYGFQTQPLLDATHDQIITALSSYRNTLHENDNLLIYYAGHGYYDKAADLAYWFPIDAERGNPARWINATEITGQARAIAARHVLIISDSCYSGMIARGDSPTIDVPQERKDYLEGLLQGRSRYVIASGGDEPVADNDPGHSSKHSVFANALLRGLRAFDGAEFAAEELFYKYVRQSVIGGSQQKPEYDIIRDSGHNSGGFVFFGSGTAPVLPVVTHPIVVPAGRVTKINPEADAIVATLSHYKDAYESMDIGVLKTVWPSLTKTQVGELKAGFKGAQAVKVEVKCGDPILNGDNARVSCDQSMAYTLDGKRQPPETHPVDILLHKVVNGNWLVDDVRAH
jgi:uncharacterized caspase-like protein